jgi:hypothetical protein
MRKLAICLSLAAGLTVPATAMGRGNPARQAARQACITERQAIGARAFRQKYGVHGALQACITQHGGGAPKPRPNPEPKQRHRHGGGEGTGGGEGNNNNNNNNNQD